jgi:hypothetical protein
MLWIKIFLLSFFAFSAELPRFYTKHSPETLRYISMDGRYAYVQKKAGVLGFVSSFRSVDFLSEKSENDFLVKASRAKARLVIESIPNVHNEMSLIKNHKLYVVDYGNTQVREVGFGRGAKLHLKDEWVSYYDAFGRMLHIQNLVTQKKYEIRLSPKKNPFFVPEVEMISARQVIYTDINENGFAAMISFDLETKSSTIFYKSSQNATRIELCQNEGYMGIGEFPYEGVSRGSKIQIIKLTESINLAGYTTLYNSVEQDLGNMICFKDSIYFIKTLALDKGLNHRITEAVKLDLKTQKIQARSELKTVSQLIEMDSRILIPFRGEFYVLEGESNIGVDTLKTAPTKEELELDI